VVLEVVFIQDEVQPAKTVSVAALTLAPKHDAHHYRREKSAPVSPKDLGL
jgi:hypothetical protein